MTNARLIVEAMHGDLDRHQRALGSRSMRLVSESMLELRNKLDRARLPSWGAASDLAALSMAAAAMSRLQARQATLVGEGLPPVAASAQRRQAALLRALDTKYAGAARPLRFDSLAWLESQTASQIRLRQFPRSFARYGAAATAEIEEALSKLALTGQPWTAARGQVWRAVRGVVGDRQWMVDRIIRTETSAIYNGTALAAMLEEDTPESPMFKRLVATFDKVTGWDSRAVHGQIRKVKEPFLDPRGRLYMAPPNRPHDREIVIPHRAAWGERVEHLGGPTGEAAEETATPEPLPAPPPLPAKRRVSARVATASAAVLVLVGELAEARRKPAAEEEKPARPQPAGLLAELELARVRLAAARLADDALAHVGVAAGTLKPGEVLSAAGLVVRVASVRAGSVLRVVLSVGGQRIIFDAHPRTVVPFRRAAPTLAPRGEAQILAIAAVTSVLQSMTRQSAPVSEPAEAL